MEKKNDKEYIFMKEHIKEEPSVLVKFVVKVLKLTGIGVGLALTVCLGIIIFGGGFKICSGGLFGKDTSKKIEDENILNETKSDDKQEQVSPDKKMKSSLVIVKVENYKTKEEKEQQENKEKDTEEITLAISDNKEVQETTTAYEENATKKEQETTTACVDVKNTQTVDEHMHLGIIVEDNGGVFIVLPNDKIENGEYLTVTFCDGMKYEAVVTNENEGTNLAIAKVEDEILKESTRNSIKKWRLSDISQQKAGSKVWYASIEADAEGEEILFEKGKVSNIESGNVTYDFYYTGIVTDVIKQSDNAGFIFDEEGNVLAMSESVYDKAEYEAFETGIYIQDISKIIDNLVKGKPINYVGIIGESVTDDMRNLTGEDMPDGVYVTDVDRASAAYKAGLMVGDIIVNVNSKEAKSLKDIQSMLEDISANRTLAINIKRKIGTGYNDLTIKIPVESN